MSETRTRDRSVLVIAPTSALTALIRSALEEAAFSVHAFDELTAEVRSAVRGARFAGAVVAVSSRQDLLAIQGLRRADRALPVTCIGDAFLNAESVAAGAKSFLVAPVTALELQYEVARLSGHEIRG